MRQVVQQHVKQEVQHMEQPLNWTEEHGTGLVLKRLHAGVQEWINFRFLVIEIENWSAGLVLKRVLRQHRSSPHESKRDSKRRFFSSSTGIATSVSSLSDGCNARSMIGICATLDNSNTRAPDFLCTQLDWEYDKILPTPTEKRTHQGTCICCRNMVWGVFLLQSGPRAFR